MTDLRRVRGTELRYLLTWHLVLTGQATITELLDGLHHHGFDTADPPPKVVSDALRWEMAHGRVYRRGRGRYGPGYLPRSTEHRIHQRVLALRAEAQQLLLNGQRSGRPAQPGCDSPA